MITLEQTAAAGLAVSVVIPIFNESGALPTLVPAIVAACQAARLEFEVVAVNDGSRDSSLAVLQTLAAHHPELVIVDLARNYGQTAAIAAGVDHARGRTIVTLDADLQHDPALIPSLVAELGDDFDIVSGWRQVRTDSALLRRLPSAIANGLMRWRSGVAMRDFGSTFKAYRADLIKGLELFGELHRFIPVLAAREGARIKEVPITVHPRTVGRSNYGLSRTFGVLEDLVFLEFYVNYLTKPMRAFGKLFFLFFGVGFCIALALMVLWALGVIPAVIYHGALLLFAVFCMIVGVQFLVVGVLAELLTRIYFRTGTRAIYAVRSVRRGAGAER